MRRALLFVGAAAAAIAIAQGMQQGGSGGLSAADVASAVTSGMFWPDAGLNNFQINGTITGPARGQNAFLDGTDAGLNDVRARYFRTSSSQLGVGTTIGGTTGEGYAGLWLGVAAGSETTANYTLLGGAAIGPNVFNAASGSSLAFRIANANVATIDANGMTMAAGKSLSAVDISASSSKTVGNITMTGGSGTATVNSGAKCVCSDTSATPAAVRCTVSSTTLTAAGTDGHVAVYICL